MRSVLKERVQLANRGNLLLSKALNDDLKLKFASQDISLYVIEKDTPDNAPDAIMRIMFSRRHISVKWTILSNYCLSVLICDFSNKQILIGGLRLGPYFDTSNFYKI